MRPGVAWGQVAWGLVAVVRAVRYIFSEMDMDEEASAVTGQAMMAAGIRGKQGKG